VRAHGKRRDRVAERIRAVSALFLLRGAAGMNEPARLVGVPERMHVRRLPAGKQRGGEKKTQGAAEAAHLT